ncbi:hypothetical protein [Longispora albida]|uniref:hypothetical protein n=1 Tax=Longispora albida TaxID=203523 RepID=UPI00037BDFD0|nr:hypothetical protein [Longispora albida]
MKTEVAISVTLVFGLLMWLTVAKDGHKVWHATVATIFGLSLAGTPIGTAIVDLVDTVAGSIS